MITIMSMATIILMATATRTIPMPPNTATHLV